MSAPKRQPNIYVIKITWRGTSKTLRVPAYSEEVALRKAERMKENTGFWDMTVLEEIIGSTQSQ